MIKRLLNTVEYLIVLICLNLEVCRFLMFYVTQRQGRQERMIFFTLMMIRMIFTGKMRIYC